jgi:enoyl-CoA hydratase/carnithine racemase
VTNDALDIGTAEDFETRDGITYSTVDGVATVTFDRPQSRNALTPQMQRAYLSALLVADADPNVRAIVITGAGTAFCAGTDFSRIEAFASGTPADMRDERPPRFLPFTLTRPVIAAINGPAVGVGFLYAVSSDVRFAGEGASFSLPFSRLGSVAEYGLSWLLPRLVGTGNACDLLLSGRTIDAAEALAMGLVRHVVPDDALLATATAYAREIALRCSPRSLATIRAQIYGDLDRDFRDSFDASVSHLIDSFAAPDFSEGVAALRAGRIPQFPPFVRAAS